MTIYVECKPDSILVATVLVLAKGNLTIKEVSTRFATILRLIGVVAE